jgi:hypothetical protein
MEGINTKVAQTRSLNLPVNQVFVNKFIAFKIGVAPKRG